MEVNETAEKLTHKKKADFNLKLKSTLLFYKFYALIFAVDFRFSLCYPLPPKRQKNFCKKYRKNRFGEPKVGYKKCTSIYFFLLVKENFIELFVNQNVRIGKCPQR